MSVQGRQIIESFISVGRGSHAGRLLVAFVLGWTLLHPSAVYADPPQFGVEASVGTSFGLSSYLRNTVLTQSSSGTAVTDPDASFVPALADVETGQAFGASLQLVASNLTAGASFQWFELPAYAIHHRGTRALPPSRRRADGSVDDSGSEYSLITPTIDDPIPDRLRNSLLVVGLGGDYRFYWPDDAIDFYVPVGAEVVLTHVTRPASPYRLGLALSSGFGAVLDINSRIALVFDARLHALATSHYGRRNDSARRAAAIGESTESAFFSTLIYASGNVGVQFTIR